MMPVLITPNSGNLVSGAVQPQPIFLGLQEGTKCRGLCTIVSSLTESVTGMPVETLHPSVAVKSNTRVRQHKVIPSPTRTGSNTSGFQVVMDWLKHKAIPGHYTQELVPTSGSGIHCLYIIYMPDLNTFYLSKRV
jgi:hypothetical protein